MLRMTKLNKKLWTMMTSIDNKYHTIGCESLINIFKPEDCISDVNLRTVLTVYFGYLLGSASWIISEECGDNKEYHHEQHGVRIIERFLAHNHLDYLYGDGLRIKAINAIQSVCKELSYSTSPTDDY